jgi:uncharacterized MAPEG superfamily protein
LSELVCLELSVVLWIVHVLIQGGIANAIFPRGYLATARDAGTKSDNVYYGRATRALANYVENLAPFVALDLGLIVTNHTGGWGATVWIVARALYIPLYLAGTPFVRTLAWLVAVIGLVMMLVRLAFS